MSRKSLAATLELHRSEERRQALRALLMRPLLTAADASFAAVRRHAEQLRPWLLREAGWLLQVDRDHARLFKRPSDLNDGTRGAVGFDRRRYVLLCLACACLERAESQITLRGLGDELIRLAGAPELAAAGYQFGLEHAHERRELVQVCRFLISWGALSRVAGDEDSFVLHAADGGSDALYDVHRRVLAGLLACARGPSTFAPGTEPRGTGQRLAAMVEEYVPDTPDALRTALRHQLARRLLDDPVVYFDELDPDARDYLMNQRGVLAARLSEATELQPEQRAEGVAMVDAEGELSDVQLPAEGTLAHATLLVAQYLVQSREFVPEIEVASYLRRAADEYGRYWRKAERAPGAELALAREALGQLDKLRLISFRDGAVRARPALARYSLGAPTLQQAQLELS
ncbi:MAG TPA: TIGR02678 family protein [Polyangiales bacterium]|nr:TIGR02678 family protein [Polyangiales bacterium]